MNKMITKCINIETNMYLMKICACEQLSHKSFNFNI